jgi:hypothetical protein
LFAICEFFRFSDHASWVLPGGHISWTKLEDRVAAVRLLGQEGVARGEGGDHRFGHLGTVGLPFAISLSNVAIKHPYPSI